MKTHGYHTLAATIIGICTLLSNCKDNQIGSATPEAAAQYTEMTAFYTRIRHEAWFDEELEQLSEANDLISHFDQTADARYATPQARLTMLHMACLFKKKELAACLLRDGADPNAVTRDAYGEPADTPLCFAMAPGFTKNDTDEKIIELIELLIKSGAKTDRAISYEAPLLTAAAYVCESERVAMHLLQYAPKPTSEEIILFIQRGWADLLETVLAQKERLTPEEASLIVYCAVWPTHNQSNASNRRLTDIFLAKGADINAQDSKLGYTALYMAAEQLKLYTQDQEKRAELLDYIGYLLSKGADANMVSHVEGLSAYDLIASNPENLQELAAKGYALTAPPMEIRPGEHLLTDIFRAGVSRMSSEQAAPFFDTIASVYSPTHQQLHHPRLTEALIFAAELMERVDTARTSDIIEQSSIWNIPIQVSLQTPESEEDCQHHLSAADLIYILKDHPKLSINKEKILKVIQEAVLIKDDELAATAAELLGRCPEATEDIEQLLRHQNIAVQAGAWGAKLHHAGLPPATNGGVRDWLEAHQRTADSEILQTALLVTSLEEMWFNKMTPQRKQEFLQALQQIGAPENALLVYGQYVDNMDNPEQLDELSKLGKNWLYELEIVTAKYILANQEEFIAPATLK